MKIKLTATASSNCTYRREDTIELGYTREEWEGFDERAQREIIQEFIEEFVWNDIDVWHEVIEDE